MKKITVLLIFVVSFLTISCGVSKKTTSSPKKIINGTWTLNNITLSEYGNFKISFFDDASKGCFEGSTWHFIANNNTGNYEINKPNCTIGNRNFIFTIQEIDPITGLYDFLLKPTDEKHKSETNLGYRLKLTQLSSTEMQWTQKVVIDNKNITINMNFTKNL
jgi:hypothetical protein